MLCELKDAEEHTVQTVYCILCIQFDRHIIIGCEWPLKQKDMNRFVDFEMILGLPDKQ